MSKQQYVRWCVNNVCQDEYIPPEPPEPPIDFDPSLYFPLVADATDPNLLRHLPDDYPYPYETDEEINDLPKPLPGQSVYAVKNLGTLGGWLIRIQEDVDAYPLPSGFGIGLDEGAIGYTFGTTIDLDLFGIKGYDKYVNFITFNEQAQDMFFVGVGKINAQDNLEHVDINDGAVISADPSNTAVVSVLDQKVRPPLDGALPRQTAINAEGSYIFGKGLYTRGFVGSKNTVPDWDWNVYAPLLEDWLNGVYQPEDEIVIDATDINNLRHWDGITPYDSPDELPLPELGQSVEFIRNSGSFGGWFGPTGPVPTNILWEGDCIAFQGQNESHELSLHLNSDIPYALLHLFGMETSLDSGNIHVELDLTNYADAPAPSIRLIQGRDSNPFTEVQYGHYSNLTPYTVQTLSTLAIDTFRGQGTPLPSVPEGYVKLQGDDNLYLRFVDNFGTGGPLRFYKAIASSRTDKSYLDIEQWLET